MCQIPYSITVEVSSQKMCSSESKLFAAFTFTKKKKK